MSGYQQIYQAWPTLNVTEMGGNSLFVGYFQLWINTCECLLQQDSVINYTE